MNLLTVRQLPIHDFKRGGCEHRVRIDPNLARLVHDNLQLKYPGVKIGKRFALEYALMSFLSDRGLLNTAPEMPALSFSKKDLFTELEQEQ